MSDYDMMDDIGPSPVWVDVMEVDPPYFLNRTDCEPAFKAYKAMQELWMKSPGSAEVRIQVQTIKDDDGMRWVWHPFGARANHPTWELPVAFDSGGQAHALGDALAHRADVGVAPRAKAKARKNL